MAKTLTVANYWKWHKEMSQKLKGKIAPWREVKWNPQEEIVNPNHNRRRGKNVERALAKRVGGRRVGLMGKDDIEHPVYSFEAKSRVRFGPERWMEQAERNAPEGKVPAVIIHVLHQPYSEALVMIRLKDFEADNGVVSVEF